VILFRAFPTAAPPPLRKPKIRVKSLHKFGQFLCEIQSSLAGDEFQSSIVLTLAAVNDHLKTGANKVHRPMEKSAVEWIAHTRKILSWEISQYKGR
jgi:hypothetical protein